MSVETAEIDPDIAGLKAFLNIERTEEILTYDQLQEALSSVVDVRTHIRNFIKTYGEAKTRRSGQQEGIRYYQFRGVNNKVRITAELEKEDTADEYITIQTARQTMPLMRYSSSQSLSLFPNKPLWECAQFESGGQWFMPADSPEDLFTEFFDTTQSVVETLIHATKTSRSF